MLAAVGAGFLGLLHVVGAKLRFLSYIPRSGWLSFAGGASVAYVFVHLLPELAEGAATFAERFEDVALADEVVWLVALLGMVVFYGVEVAARRSRGRVRGGEAANPHVFWVSVASYGVYNALIGYLLRDRAADGLASWVTFVLAMALHFVVNDFSLREHHKRRYEGIGRWILVGAIALGAAVGVFFQVSEIVLALVVAVVAGGVVLNVLKEELPTEVESRLRPFLAGVVLYAALLVTL